MKVRLNAATPPKTLTTLGNSTINDLQKSMNAFTNALHHHTLANQDSASTNAHAMAKLPPAQCY